MSQISPKSLIVGAVCRVLPQNVKHCGPAREQKLHSAESNNRRRKWLRQRHHSPLYQCIYTVYTVLIPWTLIQPTKSKPLFVYGHSKVFLTHQVSHLTSIYSLRSDDNKQANIFLAPTSQKCLLFSSIALWFRTVGWTIIKKQTMFRPYLPRIWDSVKLFHFISVTFHSLNSSSTN